MSPGEGSRPPWEERSPFEADAPGASALVGAEPATPPPPEAGPGGETVYVPSQPLAAGGGEVVPEVRQLYDGGRALLVYSTLELLLAGCGKAQPWVAVRLAGPEAEMELARLAGADVVLRDVEVPAGLRRTGEGRDGEGDRS